MMTPKYWLLRILSAGIGGLGALFVLFLGFFPGMAFDVGGEMPSLEQRVLVTNPSTKYVTFGAV